jgi:hypothetical protein
LHTRIIYKPYITGFQLFRRQTVPMRRVQKKHVHVFPKTSNSFLKTSKCFWKNI